MKVFVPFSVQIDLKMQRVIFSFVNHVFQWFWCAAGEKIGEQNAQVLLLLFTLSQLHDFLSSLSQSIPQFSNLQSWYNNSNVSAGMKRGQAAVFKRLQHWQKKKMDNFFFQIKNVIDYSCIYTKTQAMNLLASEPLLCEPCTLFIRHIVSFIMPTEARLWFEYNKIAETAEAGHVTPILMNT